MNMKRKNILKVMISLLLVITLSLSSFYATEAKKKIKSKSVTLTVDSVTIGIGDVIVLEGKMQPENSTDTMKWYSSQSNVATVNKYGVVTALSEGETIITVKTSSKKSAKCVVNVKSYLTTKEIDKLLQSKILSEETVIQLVKNNTLSEDAVKKLIKDNTLSEENVIQLVKNNTLSEETVKKLVGDNALSEETVIQLVKNNTLSEDAVKKLIKDNTLSEETVIQLVKNNTLSEESVKGIIEESIGTNATMNWEDGTEVMLYDKQTFPIALSTYSLEGEELASVKITNINIKKYHSDSWQEIKLGNHTEPSFYKYKYIIEMEGDIIKEKENGCMAVFIYMQSGNETGKEVSVALKSNLGNEYTLTGTHFVCTKELYANQYLDNFSVRGITDTY